MWYGILWCVMMCCAVVWCTVLRCGRVLCTCCIHVSSRYYLVVGYFGLYGVVYVVRCGIVWCGVVYVVWCQNSEKLNLCSLHEALVIV